MHYYKIFIPFLLLFAANFTNPEEKPEKKHLTMIVFQGSDWCANCIRFDKKVLHDESFKTYIDQNNIDLMLVDFPQKKKISKQQQSLNDSIAQRFNFDGSFPTIIITRTDTLLYQEINYINQSPEEMIQQLEQKKTLL